MKETLYINIFGSPGSGKSTLAAELFAEMKKRLSDLKIEYVPEFAKKFCFDEHINPIFNVPENQMYIGANQYYNIYSLDKKIDIVITDSPFLMSCIYNNTPLLGDAYNQIVKNIFTSHKNLNIFLQLNPDMYQQYGRNESANQSRELENRLIDLMFKFDIPFTKTRSCEKIIEMAKEKISGNNFKR